MAEHTVEQLEGEKHVLASTDQDVSPTVYELTCKRLPGRPGCGELQLDCSQQSLEEHALLSSLLCRAVASEFLLAPCAAIYRLSSCSNRHRTRFRVENAQSE